MNFAAKLVSFFLLLASATSARPQSQALGRLFFTPEQRAALEEQKRHLGAPAGGPATTLNGVVRSSSGRNTVWVNGIPQEDVATQPGWRVGETIVPGRTEPQDLLGSGRIAVRRAPSAGSPDHGRPHR